MEVGETVKLRPATFGNRAMEGTVVWIHPENRYAIVDFEVKTEAPWWAKRPANHIRECFRLRQRRTAEAPEAGRRAGHHNGPRTEAAL